MSLCLEALAQNLGAIESQMSELYQGRFLTEPEDLDKQSGTSFEVSFPERTDRVMVGVPVGANHPEGNVSLGSLLELAQTRYANTVGVEQ